MRNVALPLLCALVAACFSKPPFSGGGGGDGGIDTATDGPPIAPGGPALIATGGRHACRITAGRVICWGSNNHDQLGQRSDVPDFNGNPGAASPDDGWTDIAAGVQHTCGVRNGAVYCWGENNFGQSAPNETPSANVPITRVDLSSTSAAERVFAGGFVTCATTTAHEAYCWGDLAFARIGAGPSMPARLGDSTTLFTQIAIADDHACAIAEGGLVHCWGEGEQRQTGRADTTDVVFAQATPIESAEQFVSLSAGHEATCGTTTTGKLVCWGSANHGQLGDAPASGSGHAPRVIDVGPGWTAVGVGRLHTCAIKDGDVYCFGDDTFGALGSGTFSSRRTMAEKVAIGFQLSQIVASDGFACALSSDGMAMRCWGSNSKGELGNREFSRKYLPTEAQLPAGSSVAQLVAGDNHTCALVGAAAPYTAHCWGYNHEQQLGIPSGILSSVPVVASSSTFTKLTAGEKHTCGITSDPTKIECWGENEERQLGSNSTTLRRFQVTGTSWTDVAAGSRMSCGIDGGNLRCWGERPGDIGGVLPTMYSRLDINWPWHSIAVGSGFAVGVVLESGTTPHLAAIASIDKRCAAGLVSGDENNLPFQIFAGLTFTEAPKISAAQAGGEHACIHRMAGGVPTVSCMGIPTLPQVGAGAMFTCDQPNAFRDVGANWRTAIPASPSMFATSDQTCALDANQRMLCWGTNSNFELGQFSGGATPGIAFTPLAWPYQWTAIAGGRDHTCGISMTDGKVYCWGENQYGQVGDGTSYEPSPVVSGVYP